MIIWQLDVYKTGYTEKKNWLLEENIEPFDYLNENIDEAYTVYFGDFVSMSSYIDEITQGFEQFCADLIKRTDGQEEHLEYHNGSEWDEEFYLVTKQVRIHESLINVVKTLL